MTSHSLPVPAPQARERSQPHVTSRFPSLRVAIAVFAALLILFGWLHLLVAMQIASTDRLILDKEADFDRLERDTQVVLLKIGWGESPRIMEGRLAEEGYERQDALYLELSQPFAKHRGGSDGQLASFAPSSVAKETTASQPPSLLESIIGNSESVSETQP